MSMHLQADASEATLREAVATLDTSVDGPDVSAALNACGTAVLWEAKARMGLALSARGEAAEAVAFLNDAVALRPDHAVSKVLLGLVEDNQVRPQRHWRFVVSGLTSVPATRATTCAVTHCTMRPSHSTRTVCGLTVLGFSRLSHSIRCVSAWL